MPVCKDIASCTEEICKMLGVELDPALRGMLADGVEELLTGILADAEDVSRSNKRKVITAEDIMQSVCRRRLPFADILLATQAPDAQ